MRRLGVARTSGSVVALVAVALPALLICVGLAVDVGMVVLARQQLQAAADAAALAGVSRLQHGLDVGAAATEAQRTAGANSALGQAVDIDLDADVQIGAWDDQTQTITPFDISGGVTAIPNGVAAVRVTARRTNDSPGGPVALAFARVLGQSTAQVQASATATLAISRAGRHPVEMVICQDQSGSFEDEFPYARTGDVALTNFMGSAFAAGDTMAYVGFGYQANSPDADRRRDTWTFGCTGPKSTEDTPEGRQWLVNYITSVPTVHNGDPTHGACWTNLYTGLLRSYLCFADPSDAATAWQTFVDSLSYNGTFENIGWWNNTNSLTIDGVTKTRRAWLYEKLGVVLSVGLSAPESQHVVALVSDGMPYYSGNSFPDTKSKALCVYLADELAARGIRIHTVCMDQGNEPPDGSKGSDTQFTSSLTRNGGYAFYTYDPQKLERLQVAVGEVQIGKGHLAR